MLINQDIKGSGYLQNWIKDYIGEKYDTLNKNQADANSKRSASIFSLAEEIMVQDTSLGEFTLVNTKTNKQDNANNQGSQYRGSGPIIYTTTKVKSD